LRIGELVARREFGQERKEAVEKVVTVAHHIAGKEGKLEDDRTKLRTEQIHHTEGLLQFGIASHEHLVMRDAFRNLYRENEISGSPREGTQRIAFEGERKKSESAGDRGDTGREWRWFCGAGVFNLLQRAYIES
jgi:hypothetical protein